MADEKRGLAIGGLAAAVPGPELGLLGGAPAGAAGMRQAKKVIFGVVMELHPSPDSVIIVAIKT